MSTQNNKSMNLEGNAFGFDISKIVGLDEEPQITQHHAIYPGIDPVHAFKSQSYAGKVVLITGASRGLGAEIALHYARAGAALALAARSASVLAETQKRVQEAAPGARVLTLPLDVSLPAQVSEAVEKTVHEFGRLDVAVANAGVMRAFGISLADVDPDAWWRTLEVNLRGVFNVAKYAVPHLQKSGGYFVAMSSAAAQLRLPTNSDYAVSKIALNRLLEIIPIEYPAVKTFAVHPGNVQTDMADDTGLPKEMFIDPPALVAAALLRLTGGTADWLSGRYISALWDLDELERDWKVRVLEKSALVNKLHLPAQ
ncbi:NAD-P-binding protein [Gloeopeniophorella convolvens]|nr:NAD-P-binding protein [Gloeopeniophorella convolvens]